jgi:acetyl esterase
MAVGLGVVVEDLDRQQRAAPHRGDTLPPVLHPEIRAILDDQERLGGPPAHLVAVAEARAGHEAEARKLSGPGEAVAEVRELEAPGPGGTIPIRFYRPRTGAPPPVVAYFHGGGWVVGSWAGFDTVCRALANAAGALVACVDYRLAPEHPYPAALEDCLAATRWLAGQAAALGADGARLAVTGDSAGGNLAAVTARRLRDEGGPPLRFQALVYPVCDAGLNTPSYREFADGHGLTALGMRRYWDLYLDGASGVTPDASPLRATDLAGLPPALVLTAEADVLRDEGEAYAEALREAGVPVTLSRYDGAVHGFWRWLAASELSRRAVGEVGAALRAALA